MAYILFCEVRDLQKKYNTSLECIQKGIWKIHEFGETKAETTIMDLKKYYSMIEKVFLDNVENASFTGYLFGTNFISPNKYNIEKLNSYSTNNQLGILIDTNIYNMFQTLHQIGKTKNNEYYDSMELFEEMNNQYYYNFKKLEIPKIKIKDVINRMTFLNQSKIQYNKTQLENYLRFLVSEYLSDNINN